MKKILLFTLFAAFINKSFAQSESEKDSTKAPTFSVLFAPQYLAMKALRMDFEKTISKKGHRLTISPYYYSGITEEYGRDRNSQGLRTESGFNQDEVNGFGLEILMKKRSKALSEVTNLFLMHNGELPKGTGETYFAYGVGYHHINFAFDAADWQTYTEDGLEYWELAVDEQEEVINRIDLIALMGYRTLLANAIILDFYAGPVIKNSMINSTLEQPREYRESVLKHHGFDGVTFRFGLSIGLFLN